MQTANIFFYLLTSLHCATLWLNVYLFCGIHSKRKKTLVISCVLSKGFLAGTKMGAKLALEVVKQPSCSVLALVGTAKYTVLVGDIR